MRTGFIYLWTNKVNGKKYLGSHIGSPDDGYLGSGVLFRKALKKYGSDQFARELLEIDVPEDQIRFREQHFLDLYQAAKSSTFYNIAAQARNYTGHGPVTREQMSKSIKKALTESKGKRVYCFHADKSLYRTFDSLCEAARSVNGRPGNIKYTCDGKFRSAYGYLWSYTNQCPDIDFFKTKSSKAVVTPLGTFATISAAALALKINPLTLKRKIQKGNSGCFWK